MPDPVDPEDTPDLAEQVEMTLLEERHRTAAHMRIDAQPLWKIAEVLGFASPSGAHYAVEAGMKLLFADESQQATKLLEVARLDIMYRGLTKRIKQGDSWAIDAGLKIMERRARYAGLDQQGVTPLPSPEGKSELDKQRDRRNNRRKNASG